MDNIETVNFELIKKIRAHINRSEKQVKLLPNRKKWNNLTTSLDTLEDSSWVVQFYIESEYPTDFRGKYLFVYGLFQALFLQQNSARSISLTLFSKKIEWETDYPNAFSVRELRNDTIGHPTNRSNNKTIRIVQASLSKYSFYYCKDDNKDSNKDCIVDVNVKQAIDENAKCINDILEKAVEDLDNEFKEYIEKHKDRKMADIFNMLHYSKEKALTDVKMRDWGNNATKKMVTQCEDELKQRYGSVETIDSYKYLLDDIHELFALIDDIYKISSESQERLKYYLMELLFVKLEELESYCQETDDYFENYGETLINESEKSDEVTMKVEISEIDGIDNKMME